MQAPLPENEVARLQSLCNYNILDTPSETAFDDLTQLAAEICQVPIALVSLVDDCRQWFKSHYGIDAVETPREGGFCAHGILNPREILQVPNTLEDERFVNNPLVTGEPHIRFYAGTPLVNPEGYALGTLCVIDRKPRQLSSEQLQALEILGRQVVAQLELRQKVAQLEQSFEEQQQAEKELARFFDLSLDLFCVADTDGYFRRLNPAFEKALGYANQELQSQPFLAFIHPEDHQSTLAQVKKIQNNQTIVGFENRYQAKDGKYHWLSWQATGTEDGFIYAIARDITEQKEAEAEQEKQNLRSRLFTEMSLKIRQSLHIEDILQTAVIEVQNILHTDRVILFQLMPKAPGKIVKESVSPEFQPILGEKIDDPCFLKAGYLDKYRQGRVSAIANISDLKMKKSCYVEMLEKFNVKANLVVPILQQEKLWGLLIAHSCEKPRQWTEFETELLRQVADQIGIAIAQAELLEKETQQRIELTASNAELEQFAYVASHDLQEPLRKIQAFSDRIIAKYNDILPPQGQDYLVRMQSAASRMQILIHDLLDLSRVTTKAQPFTKTNLKEIVQEVLEDLEILIQQNQGKVYYQDLPTLKADPLQMRQLFQNLISNALKFHKSDLPPEINITCQILTSPTSPKTYQITVEDNGIGFEEKYLDRIFNAFQRLHGRNQYEGTGMGLAICRKIVERHCGILTAKSSLGVGSKFMIILPMQQSQLSSGS